MRIPRHAGLAATILLVSACGEAPSEPLELDADLSVVAANPGNGAIVTQVLANRFIVVTADPSTGLGSLHYTSAANVLAATGFCVVPPFESSETRLNVDLPEGKSFGQGYGPAYVLVVPLGPGFPFTVCGQQALAEGVVQVHVTQSSGSPGAGVTDIGSDGVITLNSDGSDVRLHHRFHRLNGVDEGTVVLR